jgi:hypothetical protein
MPRDVAFAWALVAISLLTLVVATTRETTTLDNPPNGPTRILPEAR